MNSLPRQTTAGEVQPDTQFLEIAQSVCGRLALNKRVRRNIPPHGRLRIDRQLPFLCVYRSPDAGADADVESAATDRGTRELVTTEAAYLFASGLPRFEAGVIALCQQLSAAMAEHFGTFLLIEVWADPAPQRGGAELDGSVPEFAIVSDDLPAISSTIDTFRQALAEITIAGKSAVVVTQEVEHVAPPEMHALDSFGGQERPGGCCSLGLVVKPIYRDFRTGTVFPLVLESLRRQLATALRKTVAQFTGVSGDDATDHNGDRGRKIAYHALGPSALVKAVRIVDQQLCEVSESFDFLLQVTPTNGEQAWQEFKHSGYSELPPLTYRPLPYHPNILKRRLYSIEIERIEDPTLAGLFWEKQDEIDRQLSALRDLNTPQFLYSSLQMYGDAEPSLLKLAHDILQRLPPTSRQTPCAAVPLQLFVDRAREEIDYYHTKMSEFNATVEICDEIAAGVMVSHEKLLVAKNVRMSASRVVPLLHHEIGTHLLTYFNGRCQPFRQLYAGLAGYEELQEGLAVMAEYLVGGLSIDRARMLAARVMAVDAMIAGASFATTFTRLREEYGLPAKRAFNTALRVFRGGGLTKDVIYLRGFRNLLSYLSAGHDIEPLYVGKIGLQHIPYVQELRRRKIIVPPHILPRFLGNAPTRQRMEAARGQSVQQLMESLK